MQRTWLSGSLLGLGLAALQVRAFAEPPAAGQRVLTVGSVHLEVSEVQARFEALPTARRLGLGAEPDGRREALIELLTSQLLLDLEVESWLKRGPTKLSRHRELRDRVLSEALQRSVLRAQTVSESEVSDFYQRHRHEYHQSEAIHIWRILTPDRAKAADIIRKVKDRGDGAELWWALSRENSTDDATKWRFGNLGMVQANGHTDVPQVRVNPGLFAAAQGVKDGELVAEPVGEGDQFAVVWRRGTRPETERPLEKEKPEIEAILRQSHAEEVLDRLLAAQRRNLLRDYHPELLETVDFPPPSALRETLPRPARSAYPAQRAVPTGETRGDR